MLETFASLFGIAVSLIWIVYLIYTIFIKTDDTLVYKERIDAQTKSIKTLESLLDEATMGRLSDYENNQRHLAQLLAIEKERRTSIERTFEAKLRAQETANNLWKATEEARIRKDANNRQRNTMRGQGLEQLAPLTLFDTYVGDDFRWMGNPVDYLIIDGLADVTDGVAEEIRDIILIDVKTGKADLSKVQRRIRDAVVAGKFSFAIYNIETQNIRIWRPNDIRTPDIHTPMEK